VAAGMGVRGVDQLVGSLDAAARELAGLTRAHTEAGELIATRAHRNVRRATGHLDESHAVVVDAGNVEVVNTASYAPIVHAYDPWLARSLGELTDQLVDVYADGVAGVVATIKGA
jgi:hypothetical protein